MKTRVKAYVAACAAALLVGGGGAASAHNAIGSDKAGELALLTEAANLVVLGTVSEVRYVNATDRETGALVPHVFVTYRVEQALRGKPSGETVTLRFLGGPDGQGGFLEVSGVPKFQAGERDVLFIVGSGEKGCALTECEWGRFRVLGDRVYNTHGSPVRALVKDNAIARGLPPSDFRRFSFPAPTFEGLMQNPQVRKQLEEQGLDFDEAKAKFEAEAPKTLAITYGTTGDKAEGGESDGGGQLRPVRPVRPGSAARPPLAAPALAVRPELLAVAPPREQPTLAEGPIALEQFLGTIKRLAREAKRAPDPVRNADPKLQIRLTAIKPTAYRTPPVAQTAPPSTAPTTPSDADEAAAYAAQNSNPVIPR